MDDLRLKVNEELMDAMAARIDDLERRIEALVALLKRDSVCKAIIRFRSRQRKRLDVKAPAPKAYQRTTPNTGGAASERTADAALAGITCAARGAAAGAITDDQTGAQASAGLPHQTMASSSSW